MTSQEFIEITKCPFCSSEDLSKHRKRSDNIWVLICNNCDLGFVEKYPKEIQDLYDIDYYEKKDKRDEESSIGYVDYREINYSYFLWSIALVSLMGANDSIFDLGSSNGLFLDLAKAYGFNILSGVEYNSEYADICRTKGYQVYNKSFIDINFCESERFEVVTAWAVLEHIPELNDVVSQIKLILDLEGVLLFEVPCLVFDETQDNYWLSSSLEHIYYFTEKSLKNITAHFFGQEYIGRVVTFDKYGATIIGYVSPSQLKMKGLENTGKHLQEINQDDLKNISVSDLISYLIFYLKYVNDIQTSKIISQYISEYLGNDSNTLNYFISFLSQSYIKLYEDNTEYTKAKDYFIHQIESFQSALAASQSELATSQSELAASQSELAASQSELAASQSELAASQSELAASQSELAAIKTSKFWKLRQKWFKLRRLIGVTNDDESLSFKRILKSLQKQFDIEKDTLVKRKQKKWHRNFPLISVVIPCYNYGKYVEEAIDSVLNQTFQDFEIIVVDGGSTDDSTIKILNSLQKPKTTIYYREGRHLVGDNRNFGIEKSKGKYICCLDADDKIRPTYLEKALFLLETAAYDIVSTSVQCFGRSTETWGITIKPKLEEIVQNNQISTVAVFSKQLWKDANGYHDYGIGKDHIPEDWDLWVRMIAMGARVINILEPLMLYRIHGNHISLSNHPNSISFKDQGEVIKSFNKDYLNQYSYRLSLDINQKSYQVIDGNMNLVNSYLKDRNKEEKTKILFALPFTITGGADTILLQIAKYLSENGFDISVITTIATDPILGDNTTKYESITREIYHLYRFLESQERWKDFIYYHLKSRQIKIIFIVGSSYFYDLLPDIKKDFPHIRIVDQLFNEHGHIVNNRKYARLIDMNILANQIIQNILLQEYKEEQNKTAVIVHGVDTQIEFNPVNVNQELVTDVIPKDKFIVSYMGRFSEEKCPQKFVDMVNKLRRHEDIYFLMIGNGPEYELVREKISKLGLTDKIYAPGFVEDNKPFLKASNLLIIPSKIEGIPIVLMESLSLGVPVIASNVGGIPDVITDSYNGFVCNSGNIDCFVDNILKVYSDKSLQSLLKENARSYAENCLDIAKMNQKYQNILLSLIGKGIHS